MGNRKIQRIMRAAASPFLAASLFFSAPAFAETQSVLWNNRKFQVTVDEELKEYSIIPPAGADTETVFAHSLINELSNELVKNRKSLEEKIGEFALKTPGAVDFAVHTTNMNAEQNEKDFSPYLRPSLKAYASRHGRDFSVKFSTDSEKGILNSILMPQQEQYFMHWKDDSSIVLLVPKDANLKRHSDTPLEKNSEESSAYELREKVTPFYEEREVGGMLLDAVQKRIMERAAKTNIAAEAINRIYRFGKQYAGLEKERREKVIADVRRGYKAISYTPNATAQSALSTGRILAFDVENVPKQFYVFVNVNASLSPLRNAEHESLTARNESPLLALLDIDAENILPTTPAGVVLSDAKKMAVREHASSSKIPFSPIQNISQEYAELQFRNARLKSFITFMNRIENKDLQSKYQETEEFKAYQKHLKELKNSLPSLEEAIHGYRFTEGYLPLLASPRRAYETFVEAIRTKNADLLKKVNYSSEWVVLENGQMKNDLSSQHYAAIISSSKFIGELPYTGELYREFITRNVVEARVDLSEESRVFFVRTKEGWKLATGYDSSPAHLSEICSIMNEVRKNKDIQFMILNEYLPPGDIATRHSNFSRMKINRQQQNIYVNLPDSYLGFLPFSLKNISGKTVFQNNGLDGDDDNCVPYNPAKGLKSNGDICVSLE